MLLKINNLVFMPDVVSTIKTCVISFHMNNNFKWNLAELIRKYNTCHTFRYFMQSQRRKNQLFYRMPGYSVVTYPTFLQATEEFIQNGPVKPHTSETVSVW